MQSLELAVLEHPHEGLGGLFLPSVLSPPTQQTSHRSWRAPAGAGGGSPRERHLEEKPTSLPIASVRDKTTFRKKKISVECSGQALAQEKLSSIPRGPAQWLGAGISPVSLSQNSPHCLRRLHGLPRAEGSGSRNCCPHGGGSVTVPGAWCWRRAAVKPWNEVSPCLCRGRSPHSRPWGTPGGLAALQRRQGGKGAGHSWAGASWKLMRLDSWPGLFPAAAGSGSSGVSALVAPAASSSSSSMLGQADWSSTRFSRSFRAFSASCLQDKGTWAG